jgi:hypothetical protein
MPVPLVFMKKRSQETRKESNDANLNISVMAQAPSFSVVMLLQEHWWPQVADPRATRRIFWLMCKRLLPLTKAMRWHFVCDNLNTHQSESLVRWVAQLSGSDEDLGVSLSDVQEILHIGLLPNSIVDLKNMLSL